MSRVWAVARHTIATGVRMKVALLFMVLIGCGVVALPFLLEGDGSLAGALHAYLNYALMLTSVLLSLQTIFLSWTLSEEVTQRQILMLMSKPLARWHYIVGKWLGIVLLDAALLAGAGAGVYGMGRYMSSWPERIEGDHQQIASTILTARHVAHVEVPDFTQDAVNVFERRVEEGRYRNRESFDPSREKARIRQDLQNRWRTVFPQEGRVFKFKHLLCRRAPDEYLQLRFDATMYQPPPTDAVSCVWRFGDRAEGSVEYQPQLRRYVRGRIHTINVPTDAVAPDGTLTVRFENTDPIGENLRYGTMFQFEAHKTFEVLFKVGNFGGNLVRTLSLTLWSLLFLAGAAVLTTSLFSFPVASMVMLVFYGFVALRDFILDSFTYMSDPGWIGGLFRAVGLVVKGLYAIVPNWNKYNAMELFADGRNVTLLWVLDGFGKLGLATLLLIGLACLLFERREVAEISV